MRIRIIGGSLAGIVALGMLVNSMAPRAAASAPGPVTHTVTIDSMQFHPDDLTVKPGESVVWVNHDAFPHTVTATGGPFDSKEIAAGESWTFTASARGDLAYTCTIHPTMKGMLRVK
jgi:plastocyanin